MGWFKQWLLGFFCVLILPMSGFAHHRKDSNLSGVLREAIVDTINSKGKIVKTKKVYKLFFTTAGRPNFVDITFENGKIPRDFKRGKVKAGDTITFIGHRDLLPGKPERVVISKYTGKKVGGPSTASALTSSVAGPFRLAVIVEPEALTNPYDFCTLNWIQNAFFNYTNNLIRESSYNQTWLEGEVFAPVNGAINPGPYNDSSGRPYNHFFYVRSLLHGTGADATVGGLPSNAQVHGCPVGYGGLPSTALAHELGHNLGLGHASSGWLQNGSEVNTGEYGDNSSPMGAIASCQYNAPQKYQLGWIPESKAPTISNSGIYDISALTTDPASSAYPLLLKILKPNSQSEYFYLSYRVPAGADQGLVGGPNGYLNRVSVHTLLGNSYLLSLLSDNQSYSPITGFNFTVLSHTTTSARVQLTIPQRNHYTISGLVTANGQPLAGATVETISGSTFTGITTTGPDGRYQFSGVDEGSVAFVKPWKPGYLFTQPAASIYRIASNTTANFSGTSGTTYSIHGRVLLNNVTPLADVKVEEGTSGFTHYTDAGGNYSIDGLPAGLVYTVYATRTGYNIRPSSVSTYFYQGTLNSDFQADHTATDVNAPTPTPTPLVTITSTPSPTATATITPTPTPTPVVTTANHEIVVKDHVTQPLLWQGSHAEFMAQSDSSNYSVPGIAFIGNGQKLTTVGAIFAFKDGNGAQNYPPLFGRLGFEFIFFPSTQDFSNYSDKVRLSIPLPIAWIPQPSNPNAFSTIIGQTSNGDNLYYFEFDVSSLNIVTIPGQTQIVSILADNWENAPLPGIRGYAVKSTGASGAIGNTIDWGRASGMYQSTPNTLQVVTSSANLGEPITWIAGKVLTAGAGTQGACCAQNSCSMRDSASCSQVGGVFQFAGAQCGAPNNPIACCPANFNHQNGITAQDIFDFLGAWFVNDPRADFNRDGAITVQDIFDFLNAWFAGCS